MMEPPLGCVVLLCFGYSLVCAAFVLVYLYDSLVCNPSDAAGLQCTFVPYYSYCPLKGITVKILQGRAFVPLSDFLFALSILTSLLKISMEVTVLGCTLSPHYLS